MCKICKLLENVPLRVEHIKEIKSIWETMDEESQNKKSSEIFKKMDSRFFLQEKIQLNQQINPTEKCTAAIRLLVKVNTI
jgi:hypothetical protein